MELALLLREVRPIGFGAANQTAPLDVLIGTDGHILARGPNLAPPPDARIWEGRGAYVSPGWVDLHTHVWWGGTSGSIRPAECGAIRGVTTIVDAGSAGEASFKGFREFIIKPAKERVLAFLNIGSTSSTSTALSPASRRTAT